MSKEFEMRPIFARYLTELIADDLENRLKLSCSSYELECVEKALQSGEIKEVEIYLTNKMTGQKPRLDEIFKEE